MTVFNETTDTTIISLHGALRTYRDERPTNQNLDSSSCNLQRMASTRLRHFAASIMKNITDAMLLVIVRW
jgi:hypothetical protein